MRPLSLCRAESEREHQPKPKPPKLNKSNDKTIDKLPSNRTQENVYPKGPSVQFYKLFLEKAIRDQVKSYEAIAIIEWDVLVAHDQSFEKLHHAAFNAVEPFWVKGSTLAGTNFHGTAAITDHWKVREKDRQDKTRRRKKATPAVPRVQYLAG